MDTDKPVARPGYRPSHPGRIIKRNLDALGMTIEAFAEHIGTSRQTVHAIISGRSAVRAEMAVRLAQAFNTTSQFWLRMQINHDVWEFERRRTLIRPILQRLQGQETPKPQLTARRRAARRAPGITRAS
jgi:addiction module HigA family antidote